MARSLIQTHGARVTVDYSTPGDPKISYYPGDFTGLDLTGVTDGATLATKLEKIEAARILFLKASSPTVDNDHSYGVTFAANINKSFVSRNGSDEIRHNLSVYIHEPNTLGDLDPDNVSNS